MVTRAAQPIALGQEWRENETMGGCATGGRGHAAAIRVRGPHARAEKRTPVQPKHDKRLPGLDLRPSLGVDRAYC